MSVMDVADHLGVIDSTVRTWISRGHMPEPDQRVGRSRFWWRSSIEAWYPVWLDGHKLRGKVPEWMGKR